MALYQVSRVDSPAPGEFVSGLVLAAGAALARNHFAGESGATKANLTAKRVETAVKGDSVTVLTTEFHEHPELFEYPELFEDSGPATDPYERKADILGDTIY